MTVGSINATNPVWTRTIHSTGGIPLLENDVYMTTAVRAGYGDWLSGRGWSWQIEVLGVGAARQKRTGDKAHSLSTHLFRCEGLSPEYILEYPTGSQPFTWWDMGPYTRYSFSLSSLAIREISNYTTFELNASRFITAIGHVPLSDRGTAWQYGGVSDCGYYAVISYYLDPGQTVSCNINITLSWGLGHETRDSVHVVITVPPDPEGLTAAELDRYGVIMFTPKPTMPYEHLDNRYYYTGDKSTNVSFG